MRRDVHARGVKQFDRDRAAHADAFAGQAGAVERAARAEPRQARVDCVSGFRARPRRREISSMHYRATE